MSWQTECIETLRVLINDLASTTYTDQTLQRTLAVAARQVVQEMTFDQTFVIVVGTSPSITPDPTDDSGGTRNDSFINLITLKAACIADQGSAILAAKQAIAVKDGSSSIDLRTVMEGKMKILLLGWCAAYKEAKLEYQNGSQRVAGAAVMTPFRLFAQGYAGNVINRSILQY